MKVNLKIPESLSEIKLKDYQKYMKIVDENEIPKDATEEETTNLNNFLNLKAVEIFCDVKIKEINSIKLKDFNDIVTILNKTFNEESEFKQRFKLKEIEYGFIPDLDNISMGEFIDLSKYLTEMENLHRAMAVMYRPIKQSVKDMYLIEEYKGSDELCDIMKSAPVSVVLGSQVFFYNLSNELLKFTMLSLQEKGQTNSQAKQILDENMDGIQAFTQSLEAISYSLKISLN